MQVFKLYLKIFNAHKGQIIMYIGIFISVLVFAIIPNNVKEEESKFKATKAIYSLFDYDNSEESKLLSSYLKKTNKFVKIKDDKLSTIQDELYNDFSAVVIIKKGFSSASFSDRASDYMEIYSVPGTTQSIYFKSSVNSYMNKMNAYLASGCSLKEAAEKTNEILAQSIDVSFTEKASGSSHSAIYYYFTYLAWILACTFILSISPTLNSLDANEPKRRIACSSYKFSRINTEIYLGLFVTGLGISLILLGAAAVLFSKDFLTVKGAFYSLNILSYSAVSIGFALLISKLTTSDPITSMYANVISLGMSFLSGVFVPYELLSDTVIKIAHCLPAYYYVSNIYNVEGNASKGYGTFFTNIGIQWLFAIALIVIATVIEKNKKLSK